MAGASGSKRPGNRRSRAKEDKSGAWLTTYADAVTLLMAFFVLLYAMSEIDTIKFTAFLEGLRVPFGNSAGEGLLPATDGLQPEETPRPPNEPADRLPSETEEESLEEQIPRFEVTPEVIEALQRLESAHDQLDVVAKTLQEALALRELDMYIEQRREERGLVVSIASDDVLFSLGSVVISDIGREVIEVVAETLDGFPNPLLIEGHTDNVPLQRPGYSNWNLSTDRAVAVLELMIDEHELPPDRVGAVGYGEHHPLMSNADPAGRARNRRVDIVVLVQEAA